MSARTTKERTSSTAAIAVAPAMIVLFELIDDQRGDNFRLEGKVAGNENDGAVFADGAGKGEREAGENRGEQRGREDLDKSAQPARAQGGGGFFDFLLQVCSTGCRVRTTNGRPTKVSAMTTPSGV